MELTANAVQLVQPNQDVLFTDTVICGKCSIQHRCGSGLITLRGLTNCQNFARFKVHFGANIAVPTGETVGPIALAIAIDGEPVASTTMMFTPAAVDEYGNVSSSIYIDVPKGCCEQISVRNISTIPINTQHVNIMVDRVA